jgi:NAD(P) transhydrogenase subunit beta
VQSDGRSFFNVIGGGFGGEAATATGSKEQRPVKVGLCRRRCLHPWAMPEPSSSCGLRPGRRAAQHSVLNWRGLTENITVKYAIHPVAGRMPGHMNRVAGRGRGAL